MVEEFVTGYQKDPVFQKRWLDKESDADSWAASQRFFKDHRGLLFFRDADFHARLCVPRSVKNVVMRQSHESPYQTAHAGPEKLWAALSPRFYWPRMKVDIQQYCATCDVCQKTKSANFNRYGKLLPHPIPSSPYESISLDLIVNLPWSNSFNAILVTVDRLTKHAQFIPTTTGLTAKGFALLFVKYIACRFGLPVSMICDRDPRWTSEFWRAVADRLQVRLALSSARHPQHDGQTEIVNRQLETMLRAYVVEEKASWSDWLLLLEHAYNSRTHGSTGESPYFLLYGFSPRGPLDFLSASAKDVDGRLGEGERFVEQMTMHRESARRAIAKAQVKQARSYNKGRRNLSFDVGDWVLVNPHTLEWVESRGEGVKLVQRWIGPFEVQQRINENTYRLRLGDNYPGSPVFNLQHLRKYLRSPEDLGERAQLLETRWWKPATEEYEVEKVVGHRYNKRKRKIHYLVRWIGQGPLNDSWLSEADLRNAPDLLFSYKRKHQL